MGMLKILALVLGLAVVAFVVKRALEGSGAPQLQTAPRRQLDNVRQSAARIERDAQKHADEMLEKTER